MQNIRGVHKQIRTADVSHTGDFLAKLCEFVFVGLPGEIRVVLGEPNLGQAIEAWAAGERLGQENHFRVGFMHSGNQPFPEVCWLGVGVIHAECAHTMFDPVLHHAENFLVDALLIVVEVQGVNVLVFLRWVFCIGNRAVWQHGEPFGVLCGPGVIGGALQR